MGAVLAALVAVRRGRAFHPDGAEDPRRSVDLEHASLVAQGRQQTAHLLWERAERLPARMASNRVAAGSRATAPYRPSRLSAAAGDTSQGASGSSPGGSVRGKAGSATLCPQRTAVACDLHTRFTACIRRGPPTHRRCQHGSQHQHPPPHERRRRHHHRGERHRRESGRRADPRTVGHGTARHRRVGHRRAGYRTTCDRQRGHPQMRAEEVEIGSLKVRELEVAGQRWPETPPTATQA
jgi:hypothetical protein